MSDHPMFKQPCFNLVILIICCITLFSGCSDSIDNKQINDHENIPKPDISIQLEQSISVEKMSASADIFTNIVDEHFSELIKESKKLTSNLISFTKQPSEEGLQKTIKILEKTHALFLSGYFLDACCFIYTQNIAKGENNPDSISVKTRLDQQPLLPGYLDVVDGYPYSGLIYSDIPITRENMEQEFQLGDPAYVTLGFHALELILKGSNLKRAASDFSQLTSTSDTSTAPAELRRTLYAILLASEIEKDILSLSLSWESIHKKQLQRQTTNQSNNFFLALNLKFEKELQSITSEEKSPEQKTLVDDHFSAESLALKKALLEKLSALKTLESES